MTNNVEININSIFCKLIINLMYLIIECLLICAICYFVGNFHYIYMCFLIIIIGGEFFRRNISFNSKIFNRIYGTVYLVKTEPNVPVCILDKLLNYVFALFLTLNIVCLLSNPIKLSLNENNVFAIVNTVITVSAIVLPLLFTALQQFENKFSDFGSIIEKWKRTNIKLFAFLAFYTTVSFLFSHFGTNNNINNLILCASIYMILKLILIAINVSLLMSFKLVIVDYKKDIIKWIKSWKIENSSLDKNFNLNKIINNLLKRGVKNFIKYKIWGINRKTHFSITDETVDELKIKIEPIFRIAENFIKENNLNNFKCAMDAIFDILVEYSNISKTHLETHLFYYAATKIKELFKLSVKLNYQSFPEHIVAINEKLGLIAINEKMISTSFHTIQTTNPNVFIQNSCDFAILSLHLENTPAPTQAIISLRKFASKLICNNSLTEVAIILDQLQNLTQKIYNLNSTKVVTNSYWCINQITFVLVDIINIIHCLIFYELTEQNGIDTDYIVNKNIEAFKNIYKILTAYKAMSGYFTNIFTNFGTDVKLQMVTRLLSDNPHIKTPYYNSQVQGNDLVIKYVNSISQIYNAFFVFDLNETYNYNATFKKLYKILNLYLFVIDRLIETENSIDIKMIIQSLSDIQNYFILFTHRLKETNFQQEFLKESFTKFIQSYYILIINILSHCLKQEQWFTYSLEAMAMFIVNTLNFYYNSKEFYQDLIFEFIRQLLELYNEITDAYIKNEYYKFINLLTLISCEYNSKSKISKILLKYIKNNIPSQKKNIQYDFDRTESNFLPNYSYHVGMNSDRITNYADFLSKILKRNSRNKKL